MRDLVQTAARYGLVGLANTAVGYAVIAGLDAGLGWPPALANAGGYGVGLALGFVLNRGFTFRSAEASSRTGPRYLIAFLIAFAANQTVLHAGLAVLGESRTARLLAQAGGVGTYAVLLFGLCRWWVFAPRTSAAA